MHELIEHYQSLAEQHQLRLTMQIQMHPHLMIRADWERLYQVFSNLFNNTLSYTDAGGLIQVSIKELTSKIQITIEDSAPAVSDEDLSRLCDRLYRVDGSRSRNTGGSGLGLSICETIIQAHGGCLRSDHSVLGGLKVLIELPLFRQNKGAA